MSGDVTAHDWERKRRTALRSVRPGDYFYFALPSGRYGAGRVVSKVSIGHAVEIFDAVVVEPAWAREWDGYRVAFRDVVDSYSLFDKKAEGDWRIVAGSDFIPDETHRKTYFGYGPPGDRTKVNLLGERSPCDEQAFRLLPAYRSAGEKAVLVRMSAS